MTDRLIHALALILLVCVGVRLAAWIIEPLLPYLAIGLLASMIGLRWAQGRHGGEYDYFFCTNRHRDKTACDLPSLAVEEVEEAIEQYYGRLQLKEGEADRLRALGQQALGHRQTFAQEEVKRQQQRITELNAQRDRLVAAMQSGDIPIDLHGREQRRIDRELTEAQLSLTSSEVELQHALANLYQALNCLDDPQKSYREASPASRKQHNKAFFERIEVDVDRKVTGKLKQPFALFLTIGLLAGLTKELKNPRPDSGTRGWTKRLLVEHIGFEPMTPCLQSRCSSQLS